MLLFIVFLLLPQPKKIKDFQVGWNQNSRMSIAIRKGMYKSKSPFMNNRKKFDPKQEEKEKSKIIKQHT